MAYHSEFINCPQKICNVALLPLKTKFKGPAPSQMNASDQDIIDEAIYLFKSLSEADRVLVYLVLYIIECLKVLQKASNRMLGEKEITALGIATFDLPGDPNFPQELSNLYAKPGNPNDREKMRSYFQQLRQEMGQRILDKVFESPAEPPSKWWMCFAKKKFLDKSLTPARRF